MNHAGAVRAVLLDVGGTLLECRPPAAAVYARVFTRHGEPHEAAAVAPVFAGVWAEMTEQHPRGLERYQAGGERAWWGEFVGRVLVGLGSRLRAADVLDELFEAFADPGLWHVFPEVSTVLADLRARGVRLAAVSNWDARLPALLGALGLDRALDAIVVSGVEGVEKPSPEIFLLAAARLGVSPGACLHVGDSPLDDVRGAESAGMRALLLDRHDLFADDYQRIADLRGIDEHLG